MKKYLLLAALICNLFTSYLFSDWQYKFNYGGMRTPIFNGDNLVAQKNNGIFESNQNGIYYHSPFNSILPYGRINDFKKVKDNLYLITTQNGMFAFENGDINNTNLISKSFPGTDCRNIILDNSGNIYTFSDNIIYKYDGKNWTTIDISNIYPIQYEINDFTFIGNDIFVTIHDLTKGEGSYYNGSVQDYYFKFLVIKPNKDLIYLEDQGQVPVIQNWARICSDNKNNILISASVTTDFTLYNLDKNYVFHELNLYDSVTKEKMTNYYYCQNDKFGNIWGCFKYQSSNKMYPCLLNSNTGALSVFLKDSLGDSSYKSNNFFINPNNGNVYYYNKYTLFIYSDGKWLNKSLKSLGLLEDNSISFFTSGNEVFAYFPYYYSSSTGYHYTNNDKIQSYLRLSDGKWFNINNGDLPYPSVGRVEANGKGEMIISNYDLNPTFNFLGKDSTIYMGGINFSTPIVKQNNKGEVYSSGFRTEQSTANTPDLTLFKNSNLMNIDLGIKKNTVVSVNDFEFSENYIYTIGHYTINQKGDSLNTFLSIIDEGKNTARVYDKYNSCLPDYFYEIIGSFFWFPHDTSVRVISVIDDNNCYISTTYSLIKFANGNCEYIETPKQVKNNNYSFLRDILCYSKRFNELVSLGYDDNIYIFDNSTNKYTSYGLNEAGFSIGGKIIMKKLRDGEVYASDTLGNLFKYSGNGKFSKVNVKYRGNSSFNFPIRDFSLDINGNFYIGCDFGLLINKADQILDVETESNVYQNYAYPNPFVDNVNISNIDKINKLEIIDILGNSILLPLNSSALNLNYLSKGIYLLKITDFENQTHIEKMIKN